MVVGKDRDVIIVAFLFIDLVHPLIDGCQALLKVEA